jgi:hypothetical protein
VPPRVRYGMTCVLIRYAIGCAVLRLVEIAPILVISLYDILCELSKSHGAKGATVCSVTPTFCKKNKTFCANRSTYKIIVLVKNFPKINLA